MTHAKVKKPSGCPPHVWSDFKENLPSNISFDFADHDKASRPCLIVLDVGRDLDGLKSPSKEDAFAATMDQVQHHINQAFQKALRKNGFEVPPVDWSKV